MNMEYIGYWVFGLMVTLSLVQLWFYSPLKMTLGELFFKEKMVSELEFDDRLAIINEKVALLSTCYTCFSFWTSLLVGIIFFISFSLPLIWPIATFLTYPPLVWAYKIHFFTKGGKR